MNKNIDNLINDSFDISLNGIGPKDDTFSKIETIILKLKSENSYKADKFHISRANTLKFSMSFLCIMVLFCSLSLIISPNARVLAANTFNAIKTIFVYDEKGDIVEKSATTPLFSSSSSETTTLSDSEIEQKIGYKVVFPEKLYGNFKLEEKSLGVHLDKDISYITSQQLFPILKKAINDDSEFEKLMDYKPRREITGFYKNNEGYKIFISPTNYSPIYNNFFEMLKQPEETLKNNRLQILNVGNIDFFWSTSEIPEYPVQNINGTNSYDMTQKPTGKVSCSGLEWACNGIHYYLNQQGTELTPEECAQIALEFMESNR